MTSASLSVSSQSRNKLRSFVFEAKTDANAREDEKENIDDQASRCAAPAGSPGIRDGDLEKSSPQLPQLPSQKQCPRTPTNRIPLADLIANTEDAFNCRPKDTTPEDHIYWEHGPTPRSSEPSATANSVKRGKKRARSSSPPSSSEIHKSARVNAQETLDLRLLHESLKTPQNDPALDLWARYTDARLTKKDADGKPLPAFAHLMTSSPQTPGSINGKDGGLRRSISCGTEWPASKSKRRKINHAVAGGNVTDMLAASRKEIMAPGKPKASRISLLMEKLQENSIRIPQVEVSGPSSSSPLPCRHGLSILLEASPAPPQRIRPNENGKTVPDVHDIQPEPDDHERQIADPETPSSEFGDEDLGLEILEAVEQSTYTQAVLPVGVLHGSNSIAANTEIGHQSHPEGNHYHNHSQPSRASASDILKPISHAGADAGTMVYAAVTTSGQDDDDEFDDESDDNGAMIDLAAQFDKQEPVHTPPPHPYVEQAVVEQDSGYDTHILPGQKADEDDAYDDDDDLWDQIGDGAVLLEQGNGVAGANQKGSTKQAIKRYLIMDIAESHYLNARGRQQPEKMLSVKDEKTQMLKIILLRQAWLESRCTKASYIHLIGDFDHLGQCIVDDRENMIILHPDHLISATVVADSFSCTRRAVLQDRIKATGASEPPQVYGHILHEIFGQALKANDWTAGNLRVIIEGILGNWIESLYEINTQVPQALDYLMGKMPELQAWASIFVNDDPYPGGEVRDRNGTVSNMNVNKLLEVEEHIWSPMFGLKGNVDATVQVTLQEPNNRQTQTLTVPLEFKTGKKDNNETHRAQTALYTLLLSDRYDINVTCGVLYYLETSKTFRVQAIRNEIRHMIIQRNELACYVRNKLELPPLIKKPFLCNNCYAQTACFTYHKLVDGGNGETSGLKEKFDQAVSHLKPAHQAFFRKWDELLTKEERDAMKFRRELWTMLSHEREALGRCFGEVYIEPGSEIECQDGPKINRYQYTFLKQTSKVGFSFAESQLAVGEPIVVSDEKGHFALANGYITKVRAERFTVAVDRKLDNMRRRCADFDADKNQVFESVTEVPGGQSSTSHSSSPSKPAEPMLFRVDKDEFSNGMATVRNNLIRIMEKDLFKARELRQLIVEGAAPKFKVSSSAYTITGPPSQQNLNVDQVHAVEKVMSAKDYALVLGMPGTGKTTTIAHIIRALVSQGKSVLLTSYTHTAVDNILLKIKDDNIPILRLGAVAKVHPDVKNFADLAGIPKKTMAELENSYVNSKVVASTCLGVNHPIFNARIFDYCIVDEASQITLPTCLGPIRMAKTFILVGDHYQLPPLVQNKEAQEGGLDISLFKMLSDTQPDSVVNLEHQYRMAEDIMLLSNTLIYNGRLKCGTPSVATRMLSIPNLEAGLAAHHHRQPTSLPSASPPSSSSSICLDRSTAASSRSTCWLRTALSPENRCLFLNTDPLLPLSLESTLSTHNNNVTNPTEANLVLQLVSGLLSASVPASSIGLITFYRSQISLLRQSPLLLSHPAIELHTADRFQGRDKEVVILSCVRSNERKAVGELWRDWRRVNVAVTRARAKMIIVGSTATLAGSGVKVLEGLVGVMAERGWVVDLPVGALEAHVGVKGQTLTQTQEVVAAAAAAARLEKRRLGVMDEHAVVVGAERGSPNKKRKVLAEQQPQATTKTTATTPKFKKPAKTLNGALGQAEKALRRTGILRDVVNGI